VPHLRACLPSRVAARACLASYLGGYRACLILGSACLRFAPGCLACHTATLPPATFSPGLPPTCHPLGCKASHCKVYCYRWCRALACYIPACLPIPAPACTILPCCTCLGLLCLLFHAGSVPLGFIYYYCHAPSLLDYLMRLPLDLCRRACCAPDARAARAAATLWFRRSPRRLSAWTCLVSGFPGTVTMLTQHSGFTATRHIAACLRAADLQQPRLPPGAAPPPACLNACLHNNAITVICAPWMLPACITLPGYLPFLHCHLPRACLPLYLLFAPGSTRLLPACDCEHTAPGFNRWVLPATTCR